MSPHDALDVIRPEWLIRIGFVVRKLGDKTFYLNERGSSPAPVRLFRAEAGERWMAILSTSVRDSPMYPWPKDLTCKRHVIDLCRAAEVSLDLCEDVEF